MLNRGDADLAIEDGLADVITVGVPALANPDLVERIRAAPHPHRLFLTTRGRSGRRARKGSSRPAAVWETRDRNCLYA
ncbi:hypothetical protein [Streptomyces afghaniensis]|uniref:hypothetical protein n=1 Tax=Streptomyces afghaniensis TaxID=66865 RepID=UPI0037B25036